MMPSKTLERTRLRCATQLRRSSQPALPLLIPPHRQVFSQFLQAQAIGFFATQDRFDDVRRGAGQPASATRARGAAEGDAGGVTGDKRIA